MSKYLNTREVTAQVRTEVERAGSQSGWARSAGISPQYLSDFLAGKRGPGPALLKAAGFEERPYYRKTD